MFDLTDLKTLDYLEQDIEVVLHEKKEDMIPMILVGTKCDVGVDYDQNIIDSFCQKHKMQFIKTSSKSNINVKEPFIMSIGQFKSLPPKKEVKKKQSDCELM